MRAMVIDRYGPAEQLRLAEDIPTPSVADNQVLVRVRAASVNPLDWRVRAGELRMFSGSRFPLVLGCDIAGDVVRCGSKATRFREGDAVYGFMDHNARRAWSRYCRSGAYAEYASTREDTLASKPAQLSYEEAAALPLAALTAHQVFRDRVRLRPGQRILIIGASGGVGSLAVQLATARGAEVTGVCSTKHLEMLRALKVAHLIDYTKTDLHALSSRFDVIYDVAAKSSFSELKHLLSPTGVFVSNMVSFSSMLGTLLAKIATRMFPRRTHTHALVQPSGDDLREISAMVEAGSLRPVVGATFSLNDVARAHQLLEHGSTPGKLVLQIGAGSAQV
ncbi:MAG: Zn-dependent oxidoreductase, NADPH:quinone reductase [Myxococcaceae bacterium]|nr:Zn-dependent oxidoreductase, NADPH:quinone reductase [Myxococcaceae bacterium]